MAYNVIATRGHINHVMVLFNVVHVKDIVNLSNLD